MKRNTSDSAPRVQIFKAIVVPTSLSKIYETISNIDRYRSTPRLIMRDAGLSLAFFYTEIYAQSFLGNTVLKPEFFKRMSFSHEAIKIQYVFIVKYIL